ncbi:4Fe-4S ferredoxin [Rhodococcus sp. ACS1]|uniref:4Fe-4S dicluster domain-containing protein n=1 Tax=Rhodococcus koreensis TaxID=99653 RepID=A0A1H5EVK3_9NOCA|nr:MULTISPECIES: 4Fe-4S dicluster domain-containing protein [Rhodococcus]PBC40075.1 4Fe-4S ferredoxin [Rhodococcus sp. ACS1]SED95146.1 4Fe-4S dicluster domain-containing protein [Rhodococcus koreensis]
MEGQPTANTGASVLNRLGLDHLIEVLRARGYCVVGPTVEDSAIVLVELESGVQLPSGWGVTTGAGTYRLRRRDDTAVFGHSAGPQSWKRFLHPPRQQQWSLDRDGAFTGPGHNERPYAFVGVRGCDLAAISALRRVLCPDPDSDSATARRFRRLFIVAAHCTEPGEVCFCASMGTGPAAGPGYDLALTERIDDDGHRFVVEVGTESGADVLAGIAHRAAATAEVDDARHAVSTAAGRMGRAMPEVDLRTLLRDARGADVWEDVASRCLTCGNCTMVCPTCFCTTSEDVTDLTGEHAERWLHWSSCFEPDFSYVHGGNVRTSGESRYRQWMSHKLGTWFDQFGSSGCVGCGRCIDWCPVGIDITAEAARLIEIMPAYRPKDDREEP